MTSADLMFEPLPGLVDLQTPAIHHVQAVTAAPDVLTITTSPERWAYAVSFKVNPLSLVTQARRNGAGRVLIRITGWVSAGRVGVGLLSGPGGDLGGEVFRTPSDGLTEFHLWTDAPVDSQEIVIRNATEGVSTVTIDSIRAYRALGAAETVTVRWIEHRCATVHVPHNDAREHPVQAASGTAPHVSIVLTVKNGMRYLPEAIESLRRQRYRNFELIVQDGASTDMTLSYLRGIKDFPVDIASEPDTGIGHARSRGYARCRGAVAGSIDADNMLHPDALSTAVAILEGHPEVAAVYGAVDVINPDGTASSSFVPEEFDLLKVIACELVPPWSTAFFSRRVCGPALFFDPSIPGCVDYDSWLRVGHLPILQIGDVLGYTRLGDQSVSCGIANYEAFCTEKIGALQRYVQGVEPAALRLSVLRHGISGIYCWAAESLLRLGADPGEIDRYVELALRTEPSCERALRLRR